MNITIVVTYTYPYIGSGIGNVALAQAEALAADGNNVTLISSNFPSANNEFTRNSVHHLKQTGNDILEKFHIPVPLFFLNKYAIAKIRNADIVHIHDALYPSSLQALIIAKHANKPVVLTQHITHVEYKNPLINLIETIVENTMGTYIISRVNKIHIINKSFIDSKLLNKYKHKIAYIPNGVDLKAFYSSNDVEKVHLRKHLNLPLDKKIVLFVGRFVPKKGFNILMDALDSSYFTIFVGDTKKDISSYDVKYALFVGQKEKEEIAKYYKASDAFILPSYGEGFPLSVQEALATGLPLFLGKNNEYIKVFDPAKVKLIDYNPVSIRNVLLNSLKNEQLLTSMSAYSRDYAQKKLLTWEEHAVSLVELYNKIINK